jgi:branched-chain amino acid transport system ATP-binding protein
VRTQLADRHYIIKLERVVYSAGNAAFLAGDSAKDHYLGVNVAA